MSCFTDATLGNYVVRYPIPTFPTWEVLTQIANVNNNEVVTIEVGSDCPEISATNRSIHNKELWIVVVSRKYRPIKIDWCEVGGCTLVDPTKHWFQQLGIA